MPSFKVVLQTNRVVITSIVVEADDEDKAYEMAIDRALSGDCEWENGDFNPPTSPSELEECDIEVVS